MPTADYEDYGEEYRKAAERVKAHEKAKKDAEEAVKNLYRDEEFWRVVTEAAPKCDAKVPLFDMRLWYGDMAVLRRLQGWFVDYDIDSGRNGDNGGVYTFKLRVGDPSSKRRRQEKNRL